jgi:hypothetical protein
MGLIYWTMVFDFMFSLGMFMLNICDRLPDLVKNKDSSRKLAFVVGIVYFRLDFRFFF